MTPMPPALRRLKAIAKTLSRAEYQRRWRAAGGPQFAAAIRRENLAKRNSRATVPASQASLRRRAKELLQRDRDQFLTKALHALRRHRLRRRAELLLHPDVAMQREVERANALRQLKGEFRAAAAWSRMTGERPDDFR
jgi:hypothetical protein